MSIEFLTSLRKRARLRLEHESGEPSGSVRFDSARSSWRLTPFGNLQCHVVGVGLPVLIAPGLWGGSDLFVPLIAELAKTFRVHWFDWPDDRGFGEPAGLRNVFRPQAILEEAIRASGERNLTVVGHSFGAWVALDAMTQGSMPQVDRLILAGAGLCESNRPADTFLRNIIKSKRFGSSDPMIAALAKSALGVIPENHPAYRRVVASLTRTSSASLGRRSNWMANARANHSGREVTCPVSFLAGERDLVVPVHSQLRLAESVGADTATIPDSGHLGLMTHPAVYAHVVANMIRQGNESSIRRVVSE